MDNFDFSQYIDDSPKQTGSYYVEKFNVTLPIRIYNYIKDMGFTDELSFYQCLTAVLEEHTSRYLYPNDICFFYPSIRYQRAHKTISCHVSGALITAGEFYYTYRPLIDNLSCGKVYTIEKTLKVSIGHENILPQNLKEFEQLVSDFNLGLDSKNVNFYDFKINAGENALYLKQLSKRKQF